MRETDLITKAKGVGEKTAELLSKKGIDTIGDLLMYLPFRYDKFESPTHIIDENIGRIISVKAQVASSPLIRKVGKLSVVTFVAVDEGISFNVAFFNMPYIKNSIHRGDEKIFRGKLIKNNFGFGLEQPSIYSIDSYGEMANSLQPVYKTIKGLPASKIRKIVKDAIDNFVPEPDFIPENILKKYNLTPRLEALYTMHFPESGSDIFSARRRLVFEEFLLFILSIRKLRENKIEIKNEYKLEKREIASELIKQLPYRLTNAQVKVLDEIQRDLTGEKIMNRLLQGDVGSGKTIIALLALIMTAENGHQGALMAPTEVLAKQHFDNFTKMFAMYKIPFSVALLTGSMTAKEKREINKKISNHEIDIVIGTHALIQDSVTFDDLALVITDEQHRFGVNQRESLANKSEKTPHTLVMSATPIPRTLAIIIYGDLDISVLDEMPANRKPIKNCVVGTSYRNTAYKFILNQVKEGHQVYVVCPKVNGEDNDEGENVVDYAEKLKGIFPPSINIQYLHGKMKGAQKNEIMEDFASGKIQILVSTTVIEVGVDVPGATVMMIEDAERFGLATLHQLRGRVGRGDAQSYCIFINGSDNPEKQKRLEILNHSNDGFEIASEDLKMRGPGDVFGIRQSGALSFNVGDIFTDSNILRDASEAADEILAIDKVPASISNRIDSYTNLNLEKLNL